MMGHDGIDISIIVSITHIEKYSCSETVSVYHYATKIAII